MSNEHLSTQVFQWRVIHSLCAVVRVVNELRNAVNAVAVAGTPSGQDPMVVDGFAVEVLSHVQALCDLLQVVEKSVPVRRMQRAAPRVSERDTWPAPFNGPDSVEEMEDA